MRRATSSREGVHLVFDIRAAYRWRHEILFINPSVLPTPPGESRLFCLRSSVMTILARSPRRPMSRSSPPQIRVSFGAGIFCSTRSLPLRQFLSHYLISRRGKEVQHSVENCRTIPKLQEIPRRHFRIRCRPAGPRPAARTICTSAVEPLRLRIRRPRTPSCPSV